MCKTNLSKSDTNIERARPQLAKEVGKRNVVIEKQTADIFQLKKDKSIAEAQLKTANAILVKQARGERSSIVHMQHGADYFA